MSKPPISVQIKQIFIPFIPNPTKQLYQVNSSPPALKLNEPTISLLNGDFNRHHSPTISDSGGGSDDQSTTTARENGCVKRSSSQVRKRKSRKRYPSKPLLNSLTLDDLFRALTIECEQSLNKYSTAPSFDNKLYDNMPNSNSLANSLSHDEDYDSLTNRSSVTNSKPLEITTKVSPQRVVSLSVSSSNARPIRELVTSTYRINDDVSTTSLLKKPSVIQHPVVINSKDDTLIISKTYPLLTMTNFSKLSDNTNSLTSSSHRKIKGDTTAFSNILCTNSKSSEDDLSMNKINKQRQRRIPRTRKQRRIIRSNENSLISNNGTLNSSSSDSDDGKPNHHPPPFSRRSLSTNNYSSMLNNRTQIFPQSFSNRRLSIYDNNHSYGITHTEIAPPLPPRRKRDTSLQLQHSTTSRSPYAYNSTSLREHVGLPLSFLLTTNIEEPLPAYSNNNNNKSAFVDKRRRSRRDRSRDKIQNSLSNINIVDRRHKSCYEQQQQSSHYSKRQQKEKIPLYIAS
ncbi:unnamed protein product [Didymodactylos carnosus]|uniref:Uncharacterized protein n=1 Tax=Didymodactylos carnosus TaxID=1234261 RepID=A0A814FPY6_9BILA|nr:unnamed protein product [Didymodactylos carnosus]CAF1036908.1 unnamed protein product [Didymodactylos carnosus]CAF3755849.1 unnamed protein product [Didymodactylos carnosus]CAF3805151.1 unnamed protein product [Didymodactylos carnosus]